MDEKWQLTQAIKDPHGQVARDLAAYAKRKKKKAMRAARAEVRKAAVHLKAAQKLKASIVKQEQHDRKAMAATSQAISNNGVQSVRRSVQGLKRSAVERAFAPDAKHLP